MCIRDRDISVGFSAHKRTAVERSRFVITGDYPMPPPEFMDKFKNTYILSLIHIYGRYVAENKILLLDIHSTLYI